MRESRLDVLALTTGAYPQLQRRLPLLEARCIHPGDATALGAFRVEGLAVVGGERQGHLVDVQHPQWREASVLGVELRLRMLEGQDEVSMECLDGVHAVDLVVGLRVGVR